MSECQDNRPTFLPEAVWKALMNLPALRYMKAPVDSVSELYHKYPIGNEKGTFAFVHDDNTFYTYHPRGWGRGEWKPIAGGIESFFEIDAELLNEGDILVYDSGKEKFIVKSGNVWNKLIDKANSIIQTNKFFNQVEEVPTDESESGVYFVHKDEEVEGKIVEFRAYYLVLGGKAIKIYRSSDFYTATEVQSKLDKKANQTQVNDIAASVDILAVTKAEKSVVDALMNGIIKQPGVDTYNTGTNSLAAIYGLTAGNNGSNGKPKQNGWDVLVREENTRYNWNGSVWVDMETGNYPEDVAENNQDLINRGLFLPDSDLSELSVGSILNFGIIEGIDDSKEYYLFRLRKENSMIQIRDQDSKVVSQYLSTTTQTGIQEIITSPLPTFTERFKVTINWDAVADIPNYGIKLHINKLNVWEDVKGLISKAIKDIKTLQTVYPFKNGVTDARILQFNGLIKYLYIRDRNPDLNYYLSSVIRKNDSSQVGIYSKNLETGQARAVCDIRLTEDGGIDGSLKRYTAENGAYDIVIDWNSIALGTIITNMMNDNNIELSNEVFVKRNYDNEIKELQEKATLNIIQDPHFKYDIMLDSINPNIIAFGGRSTITLDKGKGIAICSSSQAQAKSFQIMAHFQQGWATAFGLKAGDKIRIGAYVKAKVGENATVSGYGTFHRNDLSADKITYTGVRKVLPIDSINEWQWVERDITLKTDGTDIDQATDLSLVYLAVTDLEAATIPDELYVKEPCILFNPSDSMTGFYESERAQQIDNIFASFIRIVGNLSVRDIDARNISADNISLNGMQVETKSFVSETQKQTVRWLELTENFAVPSNGTYIARVGDDVVISKDGVVTKIV